MIEKSDDILWRLRSRFPFNKDLYPYPKAIPYSDEKTEKKEEGEQQHKRSKSFLSEVSLL